MTMMMAVIMPLPPLNQGYLRCAGSIGFCAFEEVVDYGTGDGGGGHVLAVAEYHIKSSSSFPNVVAPWRCPHRYPLSLLSYTDDDVNHHDDKNAHLSGSTKRQDQLAVTIFDSPLRKHRMPGFKPDSVSKLENNWGAHKEMSSYRMKYVLHGNKSRNERSNALNLATSPPSTPEPFNRLICNRNRACWIRKYYYNQRWFFDELSASISEHLSLQRTLMG